jgi:hypothetical protein
VACPKSEEITVKLKEDAPLVVKLDDGGRGQCRGQEAPDKRGAASPVVVINEARRGSQPEPIALSDQWELTFAGSNGVPRMSDSNMVYTQVGGGL